MLIIQMTDCIDCNNTHKFFDLAVARHTLMPLMYLYYFYIRFKYLNPQSKYVRIWTEIYTSLAMLRIYTVWV